jgi:hypothetical protein
MVVLWLFLSIFVDSWWNVRHNVDDICQITSSVFCFLVQIPHLGNDIVVDGSRVPHNSRLWVTLTNVIRIIFSHLLLFRSCVVTSRDKQKGGEI